MEIHSVANLATLSLDLVTFQTPLATNIVASWTKLIRFWDSPVLPHELLLSQRAHTSLSASALFSERQRAALSDKTDIMLLLKFYMQVQRKSQHSYSVFNVYLISSDDGFINDYNYKSDYKLIINQDFCAD